MNVWLWGATALLIGLVPCGWIALRETRVDALVALELAGTVATLALAFLSFVGALLLARFLGRHL